MDEHDCSKHDTRKRLNAVLKKFLAERVEAGHNGSDWAPVTEEAYNQLGELVHLLIELKWEEDCDGDVPVRFRLWDRTKDMQDSYNQFIVPRKVPNDGVALTRWLGRLAGNVDMAMSTLRREIDCLEFKKITIEDVYEDD